MPLIKFASIASFTSEDLNHPADNLLRSQTYRKWRIAPTECGKPASVTIKLEKLSTITAVDIGNDGCAFVEVLVARDDNNFEVLLPASSFMSLLQSRNGTDMNRVRMFTAHHLNKNISSQKWNTVKLVCTQPFNKMNAFGLTFVTLTTDEQQPEQKPAPQQDSTSHGILQLKEAVCDETGTSKSSINIGSFFAKRKKLESDATDNKFNCKDSQEAIPLSKKARSEESKGSLSRQSTSTLRNPVKINRAPEKNSLSHSSPAATTRAPNSSEKQNPSVHDKASSRTVASPSVAKMKPTTTSSQSPASDKEYKARQPTHLDTPSSSDVPFRSILRGVIYTMSGYKNPQRSKLRDKMADMGASYRPDWTDDCTHLICAFTNTPKYRAVRGKGHIVTHRWIEECALFKKKMPLKKYLLDPEDEDCLNSSSVRDTSSSPKTKASPSPPNSADPSPTPLSVAKQSSAVRTAASPTEESADSTQSNRHEDTLTEPENLEDGSLHGDASDEEDTDDEIQRAMGGRSATKNGQSAASSDCPNDVLGRETSSHVKCNSSSPSGKEVTYEKNGSSSPIDAYSADTDEDEGSSPLRQQIDTSQLDLPLLPDIFSGEHFFIHRSCHDPADVKRYIIAFNGHVSDYMSSCVNFIVADAKWDKTFDEVTQENQEVRFVKPSWIWRCVDASSRAPLEPHLITSKRS
ncbi:DNA repair protein XRCC1 isoform X2 [Hyalella azteca]|uniref:DNA repair protein XRCC1 isoform X2 n=1 Tax=Hyalella azteca TaxID=294128 RepID=A0A8B7NZ45_HYAAZ|nr:DNA repair protein XRCC1 isoform X2 [Hyalella azteca]